jgi:hypothetical protein
MPGLIPTNKAGLLTINGILMHTPGYTMGDNLIDLWVPGVTRGNNVVLPHLSGTRPYAHRLTETPYSLEINFVGDADSSGVGVAAADRMEQLQANIAEVVTGLPVPSVGTVSASLELPSGDTITADIQVLQLIPGTRTQDMLYATLEIIVPSGAFVAA